MAQAAAAVKQKPAPSPAKQAVPVFKWSGKTKAGEVKQGEMEAMDASAVEARLRQMGIEPVKVKKKPKEFHIPLPGGGVQTKDILVFTRQFSVMIDAGLPLVQALDILGTQSDNPAFKKVILTVKSKVEAGSTFADALAEHPKVFDELFVQLTRAGEIGGILDTILQRLGAYIEKNEKLARRVKGAMVYPAVVLTIAVGVLIVLLAFVTPTFEKMFKDFGGAMPAPTQFMIDLSHGLPIAAPGRADAIEALSQLAARDAAPAIAALLTDDRAEVRTAAARALGKLRHEQAAPRLEALRSDYYGRVRRAAVEALAKFPSGAPRARR